MERTRRERQIERPDQCCSRHERKSRHARRLAEAGQSPVAVAGLAPCQTRNSAGHQPARGTTAEPTALLSIHRVYARPVAVAPACGPASILRRVSWRNPGWPARRHQQGPRSRSTPDEITAGASHRTGRELALGSRNQQCSDAGLDRCNGLHAIARPSRALTSAFVTGDGRSRLAQWRRRSCQSVATRTSARRLSDRQQHGSVRLLRDRAVAKAVACGLSGGRRKESSAKCAVSAHLGCDGPLGV
jgi:hypothetical protein